jgi:1-acyl-sn-glycerol-3-phosphate acyltransferase
MQDQAPHRTWQQWVVIGLLMLTSWLVQTFLTRTKIEGRRGIPKQGPLIFVANHASIYDAMLIRLHCPRRTWFVGPGDFKLAGNGTWFLKNSGVILTKRGTTDRQSLKQMELVLKAGGLLAIFPEGGTWEKTIDDVKPGAAYLSMATGAPIMLVSIGGTYEIMGKLFKFKFPRVHMKFGEVLPPVTVSDNRKTRQQELQAAGIEMMRKIYDMLPSDDQARYDLMERQHYGGYLEMKSANGYTPAELPTQLNIPLLAELVQKPNLFAPLNMKDVERFYGFTLEKGEYKAPAHFVSAVAYLRQLFETEFKGFLEYRLGEEKAQQLYADLSSAQSFAEQVQTAGQNGHGEILLRFVGQMWLDEPPTIPNTLQTPIDTTDSVHTIA